MPYREKRIVSGRYLEAEIYPVSLHETQKSRKQKSKQSRPKQQNLNDKNAKKHLTRLINSNFDNRDLAVHLTYKPGCIPADLDQARRDIANYIRRIRGYRKRHGLPELRYIAVIECRDASSARKSIRIHHHMIMSGDMDRDEVERIWSMGRSNADRLQPDETGYTALAKYITKDPQGSKRWSQSRNLKQPEIHVNDHKYSRRKVEQLANIPEDRATYERLYPGYTFTRCEVNHNEYAGGIYISIKMRKETIPRNGTNRKRGTALQPGGVPEDAGGVGKTIKRLDGATGRESRAGPAKAGPGKTCQ